MPYHLEKDQQKLAHCDQKKITQQTNKQTNFRVGLCSKEKSTSLSPIAEHKRQHDDADISPSPGRNIDAYQNNYKYQTSISCNCCQRIRHQNMHLHSRWIFSCL